MKSANPKPQEPNIKPLNLTPKGNYFLLQFIKQNPKHFSICYSKSE